MLIGSMLALGAATSAAAVPDPVTIEVLNENGTFNRAGWAASWSSTATDPQLVISVAGGVNNIRNQATGTFGYAVGRNSPSTLVLTSSSSDWYVSHYEFDFYTTGTEAVTLNANGQGEMEVTDTEQHVSVDVEEGGTASIVFAGANMITEMTNFTVTLTHYPEVGMPVVPTTIADGEFAPTTTWYNLRIGAGDLDLVAQGEGETFIPLSFTGDLDTDVSLWCFVEQEDGTMKIYNKAYGTSKVLAAPTDRADGNTGGSSFAIMMAEGDEDYTYTWTVRRATNYKTAAGVGAVDTYFNGKNPINIYLGTEEGACLNNRSGKLAFWNGYWDAGSTIVPVMMQKGYIVDGEHGNFDRWDNGNWVTNGGSCQARWIATEVNPVISLTCASSKNNMWQDASTGVIYLATGGSSFVYTIEAPEGFYVSHYEFDAKDGNGTHSIAPSGAAAIELNSSEWTHISADLGTRGAPSFVVNGANSNHSYATNFRVEIKRGVAEYPALTAIFPRTDVERRIPAICTVGGEGEHKGRLVAIYDYRWNGGDIGGGNISLQMAYSDDNGETWSEPAYCMQADGTPATHYNEYWKKGAGNWEYGQSHSTESWDAAFGDACIMSDRETGKILMMAVGGEINFFASRRNNPNNCVSWWSEDGGVTWTAPQDRTEELLALFDGEPGFGQIDGHFIGSGKLMQSKYVKVGEYYRVYAALSSQNSGGNTRNWVLYSDDLGHTWQILGGQEGGVAVPTTGDEPKTEELPDGSVIFAGRNQSGNRNFNIFRYTNPAKGEGKWLGRVTTDMGMGTINACDGEILIFPAIRKATGEKVYLALQSFPFGGGRNHVSIAYKPLDSAADFDQPSDFATWEGRFQVVNGPSVYSTMTYTADGKIGFFLEANPNGTSGMYCNLTVEQITEDAYELSTDPDNALANEMRDQMVELRALDFGYVGHNQSFMTALEAYRANPSAEAYYALNTAEYIPSDPIVILNDGVYEFISAHHGTYSGKVNDLNMDEPVYLATDGEHFVATNDAESPSRLFKVSRQLSGRYYLYNEENDVYAGSQPADNNPVNVSSDEPMEYNIVSSADGHTYIECETPNGSNHGSLHLANHGKIVPWTTDARASQWHMKLVKEPEGDGIGCVEVTAPAADGEVFYDLTGRRVATPARGLFITNTGRKVIR